MLFWMIVSFVGQNILVYNKAQLELSDDKAVLPLALFGIGTGIAAVAAGRLSASKVDFGLIPLGRSASRFARC